MSTDPILQITQGIIISCQLQFEESTFSLKSDSYNRFVISGNVMSKAINHYREGRVAVNTLNLFGDFWVFMSVSIMPVVNSFPKIFVSISLFQGEPDDEEKTQLFRAEWDSHDNNNHNAQPHWHLYPHKYHSKMYDDFETFIDLNSEGFETRVNKDIKRIVDIRKVHFAMSAGWANSLGAIHLLSDVDILKNWLQGLFTDIKYQLKQAIRD